MANHQLNQQQNCQIADCELDHHEMNESGQEVCISDQPNTMDNICNELLERIFDFLDPKSLLNVAATCKRLQTVAAARFGSRFGDKHIWLYDSKYFEGSRRRGVSVHGGHMDVIGLDVCLRFVRCFGSNILHLKMPCSDALLERYINQYCGDALTSISFLHKGAFPIENFAKPFKNIESINVAFVDLSNQLSRFVHLFPKLRALEATNIKLDENSIDVSFPQLKHLNLKVNSGGGIRSGELNINSISKLLHANRQLQTLHMQSICAINFTELLNVISGNPFLLNLFISQNHGRVNADELKHFTSEHPMIEKLNLRQYELNADDAIAFIRQSKSLKLFEFRVNRTSESDRFLQQLDNKWQHSVQDVFIRIFKIE